MSWGHWITALNLTPIINTADLASPEVKFNYKLTLKLHLRVSKYNLSTCKSICVLQANKPVYKPQFIFLGNVVYDLVSYLVISLPLWYQKQQQKRSLNLCNVKKIARYFQGR